MVMNFLYDWNLNQGNKQFQIFYECCKTGTDLDYVFQTQYLVLLFKQDKGCVD